MTMDNEYTSDLYVAVSFENFTSGAQLRVAQRNDHPKPRRWGIPTSSTRILRWWDRLSELSETVERHDAPTDSFQSSVGYSVIMKILKAAGDPDQLTLSKP